MIRRVVTAQALLLALGAVLWFGARVVSGAGPGDTQGPAPWVLAWPGSALATIALIYGLAVLFALWKFELQGRLHDFRFNHSQDPELVERQLEGVARFYDTSTAEFAWVAELEESAASILAEVEGLLDDDDGREPTTFRTAYQNALLSLSPTWKTLNLLSYGTMNSDALPRTMEAILRVPNVFTCNLSKLGAGSEVKPHAGESTSYVRCHLGVRIPARAPITALHVGGETVSWEEGEVVAFCDGHWHGAHNRSDRDRYVLIFDVMPSRLSWYTRQFCALMVAFNVTQYLLPGRLNLDEPMRRPSVLLGYLGLATVGLPLLGGFYVYFRYLCRTRPAWVARLSGAGFGFYY